MPALAVADAVTALHSDWRCAFIGAQRGVEAQVLPERGVPYHLLPLHPIYRRQWWKNARWPFAIPSLLRAIDRVFAAEAPAIVIGTGGYVSGPVLWRAARRRIPTGILDLDVLPGIATRWLAPRVDAIWLGAAEAERQLPAGARGRVRVTGAPIVPPDRSRREAARARYGLQDARPVIVITGGSQGALALNRVVAAWIRSGAAADYHVLWATGRTSHAEFAALDSPPAVHVVPFIDPMADAWAVADLAIARAGMMTLSELAAWGIPSILVPLPSAAADHQTHNAKAVAAAGGALVISQAELDRERLDAAVGSLARDPVRRRAMADALAVRAHPDAARDIASAVAELATRGR